MASGIEEVVAPLGTALTEMQAGLLRKYTRNVFLLYDSDAPGLKATFRAGDELLRQGMSVRVVTLPVGEDPDSFVRRRGPEALSVELENAIDVFERKIQILERGGWFGELQRKRRALDRLLPTIRATSDAIMRDLYLSRAGEVTGVNRQILLGELGTGIPGGPVVRQAPGPRINLEIRARRGDRRARALVRGASAERELVRAMLAQRSQVEFIAERIGPDSFRDERYRAIFSALLSSEDGASLQELAPMLDAESIEVAEALVEDRGALIDAQKTIDDSLAQLEVRAMEERLAEIDGLLALASDTEKTAFEDERRKLVSLMRASGKMSFKAFRRGRTR
jgi:DNA primase